jgi:tetratricopeptide (TPR) repeat protein
MKELWDESLLLYSQGQLDEALVRMLAIETRVPSNGHLLANIGVVYRDKGELAMAETYLRRACMAIPDDPSARFNLALTLLRAGRLREGFREYECRWRIPQFQQQHLKLALPVWQGEPLTGQRVLLYGEQGAGDTLQFARYAPLVRAAGGDVRMVVRPDLQRLMTWMEGGYPVNSLLECDMQCPMMSLPLRFDTDVDSIPPPAGFVVPEGMVATWSARFVSGQRNVGVAWAGNPKHPNDRDRSIPAELFAPLSRVEGVRCWSLQFGQTAYELADFAETAAAISALDLVITVDTAVAHLAGSLGKPVWLLVAHACDWRWMLAREDSPWYPSMRIFRRTYGEQWSEVMERVKACLES